MQGQSQQDGMLIYQCVRCEKKIFSSQTIVAHTRRHFKDSMLNLKDLLQKICVPFTNFQQQQQVSTTISSISKQQQQHAFPKKASQPQHPRHRLRIYDPKTLARFKAHLTKKKKDSILTLLDIYIYIS
ncbi:hypothetical protein H5410_031046, partial [Solanum commersonii]